MADNLQVNLCIFHFLVTSWTSGSHFFLDLNVLLDNMLEIGKEHWFMEGHVFVVRPCERMSAWSMSCWWFPVLTKITVRDQISTVIWKRKSLKGFCLDTVLEGWGDGILKLLVQGILIHSFAIGEHILLSSNKKILNHLMLFFMFVFLVPFQTPSIMRTAVLPKGGPSALRLSGWNKPFGGPSV